MIESAFDGDLPALRLDEAANEGQSHAGTRGACSGEAVEDAGEAFGLNAAAVVHDEELHALGQLDGFEADFSAFGGVAEGVEDEIVEDGAECATVSGDVGDIFEGFDGKANFLGLSLGAVAGGGVLKCVVGAEFFCPEFAAASVEFGDFHQVGHDVVEFFGFQLGAVRDIHLEFVEIAGKSAGEGVEGEAEMLEGFLQLLRGDVEEACFEAVDLGERGDVFEEGDGSEETTVDVAHGGGAKAVAAFCLADAHGQDGCFLFSGDGLLHGDGGADGGEDAFAAGRVGEGVAVVGGFAKDFFGGAIELEDVAFCVGDDDWLEDGLDDGVGELLIHLAAAGFSFAEVAEADGEAVDFGGYGAEVVAGSPLDAMLKIAAADLLGGVRGAAQRQDERGDGEDGDEEGGEDGEPAEGDEAGAERVLTPVKAVDHDVAAGLNLLDGVTPLLLDADDLAIAQIFDAHVGDGLALNDFFVFLQEVVELDGGIEVPGVSGSGEKELLGDLCLLLEAKEGVFALGGGFGGQDIFPG